MKPKIFFLNTFSKWGGGEKWTFETALELHRRGYEVVIGAIPESRLYQRAQESGLKVKTIVLKNTLSAFNPFKLFSFRNYLRKEKINVLFLNLSQDLKFGAIAGKLAKVEKIIFRRGSANPIKNRWYTKLLLRDCVTGIIANSRATKETILVNTSDWLDEAKIKIIYNGLQLDEIKAEIGKSGPNIREEFGIKRDEILIANIGRLSREKGHQYLMEAVKSLVNRGIMNFKVIIVGGGAMENEIKDRVKDFGLEDYIIFTGFRSDIYNIMKQMDFLLHTALFEGFGFVIAEAMAVGKPVVSTDISSISEIIADGETGYLAQSKNPEDIADKVIRMMNSDKREEMGERGRKIVEEKFSFVKATDQLENLYIR
jgi:glycosyltransferase involved in cell wall biosynthesis